MKVIYTLFFALILFTGCNKPIARKNEISKIELATSGGIFSFPTIVISIDSSLTLKYYGGHNAKIQGYYTGKITPKFWDTLNMKLEAIHYKQLDTLKYKDLIMDGEGAEAIFKWSKYKRHIIYPIDNPDPISNVFEWITNGYKHIQLHKLKDSVKFEVNIMHPPIQKEDQVKFPPN